MSGRHSLGLVEDEEVAYGTREDSVRALLPELSTGLGTARGTRLEAALVAASSIFSPTTRPETANSPARMLRSGTSSVMG